MSNVNDTPDWFAGTQQVSGIPIVYVINQAEPAGFQQFGPFNVSSWDSLVISGTSADQLQILVDYFADQAMTQPLGSLNLTSVANIEFRDWVPIMGPWVRIQAQFHVGAGTANGTLIVFPRQGAREWPGFNGNLLLNSSINNNIGAGATVVQRSFNTCSGQAALHVLTDAVAWDAVLWSLSAAGVLLNPVAVIMHRNNTFDCWATLQLPTQPTELHVHNADAGAQLFGWGLIVDRTG